MVDLIAGNFMAKSYSAEEISFAKPSPMVDENLYLFMNQCMTQNTADMPDLIENFKKKIEEYVFDNDINQLTGYEAFPRHDVCIGCTQYIDDLYQTYGYDNIMTLEKDYKYHSRLNSNIKYYDVDSLVPGKQLLIAMPFPYTGDKHVTMNQLLDRCLELNIHVHIDSAWILASQNIEFNYNHPAIQSFAVSLSKGLALGSHRIGMRWSREETNGPITIMNNFHMNCKSLVWLGLQFMNQFEPGYLWKKYKNHYQKILKDFDLQPTKAIHLATKDNQPVGIRTLLMYLEHHK